MLFVTSFAATHTLQYHLWNYKNADHRTEVRTAALKDHHWIQTG
jgi:hypothetical protein